MIAVRQHGARNLRVEQVDEPRPPDSGEVLVGVTTVGICGSDLHVYREGVIADTTVDSPVILGHEFSGRVEQIGSDAGGGSGGPLRVGMRVAVDPAISCGQCELCRQGHPNLCLHGRFCGHFPEPGALRERLVVPARNCLPLPDAIDQESGALIETLTVALHATRLAKIKAGEAVTILGAGPIGLCVLQTVRLAGARPIFVTDKFAWRRGLAEQLGGVVVSHDDDPAARVREQTTGRGVDVAIEVAWGDEAIQQAAEMVRPGGRLVLVGVPRDDRLLLRHSTARRKGLTIRMIRRAKHTFREAIELVQTGRVDLRNLITHRFGLADAASAFALNAGYADGVVKVMIRV
jgi:L-iditol 2-dehydrogenase